MVSMLIRPYQSRLINANQGSSRLIKAHQGCELRSSRRSHRDGVSQPELYPNCGVSPPGTASHNPNCGVSPPGTTSHNPNCGVSQKELQRLTKGTANCSVSQKELQRLTKGTTASHKRNCGVSPPGTASHKWNCGVSQDVQIRRRVKC